MAFGGAVAGWWAVVGYCDGDAAKAAGTPRMLMTADGVGVRERSDQREYSHRYRHHLFR